MKKPLFLLFIFPLLVACSNNNDDDNIKYDETKGYLTNIESVKHGVLGVWKVTLGGEWYREYSLNGVRCVGFSPENLNGGCSKYEILQKENKYIMRSYGIEDLEGTGTYVDVAILVLNKNELKMEEGSTFTRVQ